ncbi:hypothetical protein [Streptomyces sp. BE133]|uniref:hypothetical protein n=1 Tax=Streptomyces sp. BE133 TaxID=3002523 RepID=UPI002E77E254|nr:hypothetical protein [Streptomyces sp. BE133]MEE1812204.1 hypothetical protein [Streptomyces sp. BE133]
MADDTDPERAFLGEQLSVLAKAAAGQPTRLSPQFTALLRLMLTGETHNGSPQTAIICGDKAAPRDPEVYWRNIERSRAKYPRFAPLTNNISPCAFWDRPREEPTSVRHDALQKLHSAKLHRGVLRHRKHWAVAARVYRTR